MEHNLVLNWQGGMSFQTLLNGHNFVLDGDPSNGGKNLGPRPKQLLLVSLAGCSGMDVVSLAVKMRAGLDSLQIKIDGVINDEHPKKYNNIKVYFVCKGLNLEKDKIEKAVKMSAEKYCGVWATLKPAVNIEYEVIYE